MQQCRFEFQSSRGEPFAVKLACRAPPEEQAGRTLTWQIQDSKNTSVDDPKLSADGTCSAKDVPPTPTAACAAAAPDLIGLDIWPASIALCRYLAAHPKLVEGADVLELGAGGQSSAAPVPCGPSAGCRGGAHLAVACEATMPTPRSYAIHALGARPACNLQAWAWLASLPPLWAPGPCSSPITKLR